jgi:hypothetical protein
MAFADYGVFAQTVAAGGTIAATAAALRLTFKGRARWEPAEEDIPRGAQKVCGLLICVFIATIWYKFMISKTLSADRLITLAWSCAGGALASLLGYGILVGVYVYYREVATSPRRTRQINIIGGFWLTPEGRRSYRANAPLSKQNLLKGAAYDPDLVWPRISRALARQSFLVAYIALVGFGTLAFTAASMLIASAI